MTPFKVLRQHMGDQFYDPAGEMGPAERIADAREVDHLVRSGVLEPLDNKALAKVPETKTQAKAREKAEAQKQTDA